MNSVTSTAFISSKDIQLCPICFDCTLFSCLFSLYIDVVIALMLKSQVHRGLREVVIVFNVNAALIFSLFLSVDVRVRVDFFLEAGVSIQTAAANS